MESDERYLALIRDALAVCRKYKPKFGKRTKDGLSLAEFQKLYQSDPFYNWFGLDSPHVYAAHKAAGGITSMYRQIGIGAERVFRQVLEDTLGQTAEESRWSYEVPSTTGKKRTLSLDGRISLDTVRNKKRGAAFVEWLDEAMARVSLKKKATSHILGTVFECRQGYKSRDSKRQNADIANASNAYAHRYLPTCMLFSLQIDSTVAERYVRAQWLLLLGTLDGSSLDSTYVFCKQVLGYDLAGFYERHTETIRNEIDQVLKGLLQG